ncbi:MAG: hypothetical protein IJZ51_04980 [Ruminiclostridium sp.]|nr:hypothetical protein [Ruminiclostridium sp.]
MKKIISFFSAMILSLTMSVCAFAETVTENTVMNPATGVTIDWVPIAICGGALAVAIVVFIIMSVKKKKK